MKSFKFSEKTIHNLLLSGPYEKTSNFVILYFSFLIYYTNVPLVNIITSLSSK